MVRLVAGFAVWSVAFVVLYSAQALGCVYGWGAWHRPILLLLYLCTLAPLTWLALSAPRHDQRTTLYTAALWANRSALLAATLTFSPVIFASLCT
jgi:hypothetical protein